MATIPLLPGDARTPGGAAGAPKKSGAAQAAEPVIALRGRVVQSREGAAFDLGSLRTLTVMIDRLDGPVQIPIRSGEFQLSFTPNAKGEITFTKGQRTLRLSPEFLAVLSPTIRLMAPVLSASGTTLRFYDPEDPKAAPKPNFSVPFGTTGLTVVAEAMPAVRLFVTDEATGARLDDASVYRGSPSTDRKRTGYWEPPPITAGLEYGETVAVPAPAVTVTSTDPPSTAFEVRVPGYSPAAVQIDFERGRDVHAALSPSGSLLVKIVGDRLSNGQIQVRPVALDQNFARSPYDRPSNGLRELTIEDLPPGPRLVSLLGVLEDARTDSGLLDCKEVEIVSGQMTEVFLTAKPNVLAPVQFSGTILLPATWEGISSLSVTLLPKSRGPSDPISTVALPELDESMGPAARNWVFAFNPGPLLPGRYELRIVHPGIQKKISVPPAGTTEFSLKLDEPIEVRVRTVVAGSDKESPHDVLYVGATFPDELDTARIFHGGALPELSDPTVRAYRRRSSEEAFTFQATSQSTWFYVEARPGYESAVYYSSPRAGIPITLEIAPN